MIPPGAPKLLLVILGVVPPPNNGMAKKLPPGPKLPPPEPFPMAFTPYNSKKPCIPSLPEFPILP